MTVLAIALMIGIPLTLLTATAFLFEAIDRLIVNADETGGQR